MVGCPVFFYQALDTTQYSSYLMMKDGDALDYLIGFSTDGGSDQLMNECGLPQAH